MLPILLALFVQVGAQSQLEAEAVVDVDGDEGQADGPDEPPDVGDHFVQLLERPHVGGSGARFEEAEGAVEVGGDLEGVFEGESVGNGASLAPGVSVGEDALVSLDDVLA